MRAWQHASPPPQVDRLGERLRQNEEISEVDLEALQGFRAEHETALVEVQTKIQDALPGIDQTARIKTIQTLHDKLRRQPTKLSRIQDIAGVRIVEDMDRLEQDRVVAELQRAFPGARAVDRRVSPTFGYRAVHVVVRIGRCSVEIQVRTRLQHLWAQVVERLGDRWGRQIRYGGEPDDPERKLAPNNDRRALWRLIRGLSDSISALEEAAADQNFGVEHGLVSEEIGSVDVDDLQRQLNDVLAQFVEFVKHAPEL